MKTVLLCGGFGTRIRDVAEDIPKPMIPIGNLPILWHIMKYYSCFGHKDFVLCLGYKSEVIKDFFLNYKTRVSDFTFSLDNTNKIKFYNELKNEDWTITFAETGLKTMTGGRVSKIKKYIENDETFMLTYGDGLGDIDLKKLLEFHKSHGKIMTITGVNPPGRFGELEMTDNKITAFNEKPQTEGSFISGGFFVCNKKIFDYLEGNENLVLEKEPMINLVKDEQMMIYKHTGFWHPMDTSREYKLLNELYNKNNAPWKIW
jgi:glucose-1-phosphate cytidylyltransferase